MYWAVNHEGTLCGVVLPAAVWLQTQKAIAVAKTESPYLSVAVTGLSTDCPELRLVTITAEHLYDFCRLKSIIYRSRQTPDKLKLEPDKIMGHIGLADGPPLETLKRWGKPDKGEFFTFMPDKERINLYYLIEEGQTPPPKLDVEVLWGLKGYSLPRGAGGSPTEFEKLVLERTEIKPHPLWLRRLLGIRRRRRK
ncbi:hypothetical protein DGWBC_0132 [Dehalogenimonas sp. WBC-2]|nr:hypothetical protein DGWBC_0132 [Dehalogenimonas sp. WBC-2]